jgi:hypothetical protein
LRQDARALRQGLLGGRDPRSVDRPATARLTTHKDRWIQRWVKHGRVHRTRPVTSCRRPSSFFRRLLRPVEHHPDREVLRTGRSRAAYAPPRTSCRPVRSWFRRRPSDSARYPMRRCRIRRDHAAPVGPRSAAPRTGSADAQGQLSNTRTAAARGYSRLC